MYLNIFTVFIYKIYKIEYIDIIYKYSIFHSEHSCKYIHITKYYKIFAAQFLRHQNQIRCHHSYFLF